MTINFCPWHKLKQIVARVKRVTNDNVEVRTNILKIAFNVAVDAVEQEKMDLKPLVTTLNTEGCLICFIFGKIVFY